MGVAHGPASCTISSREAATAIPFFVKVTEFWRLDANATGGRSGQSVSGGRVTANHTGESKPSSVASGVPINRLLFFLDWGGDMLYWNNLQGDRSYVIDLVQLPTGVRMVRYRDEAQPPHEYTALSTVPCVGSVLKALGRKQEISMNVCTSCGQLFVLDPHDIWMTQVESQYWTANRSQAALDASDAPWVNHLPPKFAPK